MYYYSDYINDMKNILSIGRDVIEIVKEEYSFKKRKIYAIKLGKGMVKGIICAGVHGREYVNVPALIHIIKTYISWFNEKKMDLLLTNSIIIVPLLNPDGYEMATKGKTKEEIEWKNNARNIDLNRNFKSKLWRKKFDGDYPFSEIESKFLKDIFDTYHNGIFIDIHSRGENIYYYRNVMDDKYNKRQLNVANGIKMITGYRLSVPFEEINQNDTGGNTVHYYSEEYNQIAITIETVNDKEEFPINYKYVSEIYNQLIDIPRYILEYENLL